MHIECMCVCTCMCVWMLVCIYDMIIPVSFKLCVCSYNGVTLFGCMVSWKIINEFTTKSGKSFEFQLLEAVCRSPNFLPFMVCFHPLLDFSEGIFTLCSRT